ncbi:MAG: tRNA (N(6)-L-threonylcarbamoyladenosine(37)-C(2))-methylthiotransferase MtaB [Bacilli bacterium]
MIKTFVSVTLGCKVNAYEVDSLTNELIKNGYTHALNDEAVGIALINTCSVTSSADQKSRQQIRRLAKKYPQAILIVMGCYAQINIELAETIPEISIVIGTSNRRHILKYIEEYQKTKTQIVAVDRASRTFTYEELNAPSLTKHARAYLKIQDGCDQFCTFCIIPLTRGKLRSRDPKDVIKEAKTLVAKGYKEIVLTGIHTGAYGLDLKDISFSDLVKMILDACPTLYKLRISSIEENEIDDALLLMMQQDERLARHLHIPLQAGSDDVLRRMNRRYDTAAFLAKMHKIRAAVGDIALTTDVIVGFPGESEEDFQITYDFIKKVNFSELHVFPYSVRSKTPAASFKDQVSPPTKKARVQTLITLSNELKKAYSEKYVGETLSALIETYDMEKDLYIGHTSNYLDVYVRSERDLTHELVTIEFGIELSKLIDSV